MKRLLRPASSPLFVLGLALAAHLVGACSEPPEPGEASEKTTSDLVRCTICPLPPPIQLAPGWKAAYPGGPARVFFGQGSGDITASVLDGFVSSGYPGSDDNGVRRREVVSTALHQLTLAGKGPGGPGLCAGAAIAFYETNTPWGGDSEWCSEFARDVMLGSGGISDKCYCDFTIWPASCIQTFCVNDSFTVDRWKNLFSHMGGLVYASDVNVNTVEPGDYVAMDGGSGPFTHSGIVVAISLDGNYMWTVEGNVNDCVQFQVYSFMPGGILNPKFNAFGKINSLY